jgi:hypothetical protein
MSKEGFQLNPAEIAEQIHSDITRPGWHLRTLFDYYAHPDFDTGMMMVHDPVDRAVVVFVGSREEAAVVAGAARQALETEQVESK